MAEFLEIMKQARRICLEYTGIGCDECPLYDDEWSGCRFDLTEKYLYDDTTERIVLKWAEEHPEPTYPSWKEWQNSMFPNADVSILPCWFMPKTTAKCNAIQNCSGCRNRSIPAEIAEKLGVKPKEEA